MAGIRAIPGGKSFIGRRVYLPDMKIGIVTLGCDKNTVDNGYLAGALAAEGIEVVRAHHDAAEHFAGADPRGGTLAPAGGAAVAVEPLDAVLINTCGFVESAKVQSIQSILSWIEHKKERAAEGGRCRVFVAGCLTQRYRESLVAELPEVDGFLGVGEFDKVVQLVKSPVDATGPINMIQELPSVQVREGMPRKQIGPQPPHAFLKIADGCNHNCTFCAIPSFKGRLRSVAREILLAEARLLLSRGVREINLVAQDTSDYGKDLYGRDYGIAELLSDLARISGDFWIRLFYFYPGGLTDRFLEAFRSSPKIVPYLDMPLQHLHPEVLQKMKRPYRDVNTFEAITRLRAASPDVALRTTFITGFPGETEEHFDYLLEGVKKTRFRRMGAFPFSEEEGTPSADMKPQVPKRLRKARFDRLMRLQAGISAELNAELVGRDLKVLVEEQIEENRYVARSSADAPEVDGAVIVTSRQALRVGEFATVRITGSDVYDLFGEV